MLNQTHLYELGWLPDLEALQTLAPSFDALPPDTYAEERLRSRRYSRYLYNKDKRQLTQLGPHHFMQSSDINNYLGDVVRKYEEIDSALETNSAFLDIFNEFRSRTSLTDESIIEVHQIRWHCKRRVKVPAPEGVHQDGFDFIGMFMIDINNVDGGEAMLYKDKDGPPCFKKTLGEGEFIILDDKRMYHNASPLVPTPNDEDGHWDAIVLTAHIRPKSG